MRTQFTHEIIHALGQLNKPISKKQIKKLAKQNSFCSLTCIHAIRTLVKDKIIIPVGTKGFLDNNRNSNTLYDFVWRTKK